MNLDFRLSQDTGICEPCLACEALEILRGKMVICHWSPLCRALSSIKMGFSNRSSPLCANTQQIQTRPNKIKWLYSWFMREPWAA